MIDPKKLPPVAAVDAGVFIRSQGQQASDDRAAICIDFWNQMIANGRTIYVPAPVVAETTRNRHCPPVAPPSVRLVEVSAFDHKAAIILADKFHEQILRSEFPSGPKDYIRYDAMIVACAIRWSAMMVALDSDIEKLCRLAAAPFRRPQDFLKDQARLPGVP